MACGTPDLFPLFYSKYNKKAFLTTFLSLPNKSFLDKFDQYIIGKHHTDSFCKLQACTFHILFFDISIDRKIRILFENFSFNHQQVDCIFTSFFYYFRQIEEIKGQLFTQLKSAVDFHRSLPYPVIYRPSISKKRLFRKRFKYHHNHKQNQHHNQPHNTKENSNCHNSLVLSASFIAKVEKVLQSHLGSNLIDIVDHFIAGETNFTSGYLSVADNFENVG